MPSMFQSEFRETEEQSEILHQAYSQEIKNHYVVGPNSDLNIRTNSIATTTYDKKIIDDGRKLSIQNIQETNSEKPKEQNPSPPKKKPKLFASSF